MSEQDYSQIAGLSIFDKIKLLTEWAPVLAHAQAIASATTPHEQAVAIIDTLQFAAGKTDSPVDDEALQHLEDVLRTPEGREAFAWVVAKITKGIEQK